MRNDLAALAMGLILVLSGGCSGDKRGEDRQSDEGKSVGKQDASASRDQSKAASRRPSKTSTPPATGAQVLARLAPVVADLSHKSLRRRMAALTKLAREGSNGATAIPAIVDAMKRGAARPGDIRFCQHAAWAIGVIDPGGRRAGPLLLAWMTDKRAGSRGWEAVAYLDHALDASIADLLAASEAAGIGVGDRVRNAVTVPDAITPAQAERIAPLASSSNHATRQAAAHALGKADGVGAAALWPLLDSPDKLARQAASKALDRLGMMAAPAAAAKKHRSGAIQAKAAGLLGREGYTGPAAIEALRALLRDGTPEGQVAAAEALAVIGPPASLATVDDLLPLLIGENQHIRPSVAWSLGMMGRPLPKAIEQMKTVATTGPLRLGMGVWALSRFGEVSTPLLPALLANYRGDGLPLTPSSINVAYACEAIGGIGPKAAEAVDVLLGRHADIRVSMGPAKGWALTRIGKPAIDRLRASLRDPAAVTTCMSSLDHIALMGPGGAALIPDVVRVLRELKPTEAAQNHCWIASHAARALGSMGETAAGTAPGLLPWLEASNKYHPMDAIATRMDAAMALGRIGPRASAALPALLRAVTNSSEHEQMRKVAAEAVARISDSPEVAVTLAKALHDSDPLVRLAAANGLGWIGGNAGDAVTKLLRSGDEPRRKLALMALKIMGPAGREVRRDVLPLLSDPRSRLRREAAVALAAMGPYARDVADDVEKIMRQAPNVHVRGESARALSMLRRSEADVVWLLSRAKRVYRDGAKATDRLSGLGLAAAEAVGDLRRRQLSDEVAPGAEERHRSAAVLLGRLDPEAARGALVTTARDACFSRFFSVRRSAVLTANLVQAILAERNSPTVRQQVDRLRERLVAARAGDIDEALRELGALGPAALPAAPAVARRYLASRDPAARRATGRAMDQILKMPSTHPDRTEALVWHLRSADEQIAAWAAAELHAVGAPAVPVICQAMRDGDDVRIRSTAVLVGLAAKDRASVTMLVKTANDRDGLRALVGLRALQALGVASKSETTSGWIWDDAGGAGVIRGLGLVGPEAVDALAAKVGIADFGTREEALVGLISYGAASVKALSDCLGSGDASTRRYAAEALADLGEAAAPAGSALRAAARAERDPAAIVAISRAIDAAGATEKFDVPPDVAKMFERMEKVYMLGPGCMLHGVDKAHYPAIPHGFKHHAFRVRRGTAVLIGSIKPPLKGGVETLRKAFASEEHPQVRAAIIHALGRLTGKPQPEIISAIDDKDPAVRLSAVKTLSYMGPAAAPARAKLLTALGLHDHNAARGAAEALAAIGPEVFDDLLPLLEDKDDYTRCGAAEAMGMLGAKAAAALPRLDTLAKKDPRDRVRRTAARVARDIRKAQAASPPTR